MCIGSAQRAFFRADVDSRERRCFRRDAYRPGGRFFKVCVYRKTRELEVVSFFARASRFVSFAGGGRVHIYIYTDAMLIAVAGGHGKQCILLYAAICEM